jgi:hypothetical protein
MPQPSAFEVGMAIGKLKRHKSPGRDQIPVEMTTTEGWTIHYEIHKLINSIWKKEELPHQWSQSLYLFIMVITHTLIIIAILSLLSTT